MNCPVCKEPMIVLELEKIEIDHCLECGGIWLDGGELELLLEGAEEKDTLLSSMKIDEQSKERKIKCPICAKKMDKVLCGTEKSVLIDRCKEGDGLWFDKGELEEISAVGSFHSDKRVHDLLKDMFKGEE